MTTLSACKHRFGRVPSQRNARWRANNENKVRTVIVWHAAIVLRVLCLATFTRATETTTWKHGRIETIVAGVISRKTSQEGPRRYFILLHVNGINNFFVFSLLLDLDPKKKKERKRTKENYLFSFSKRIKSRYEPHEILLIVY